MQRITSDAQLDKLVAQIKAVLPDNEEATVKGFLDARLTAYNKSNKVDAHLNLKSGKTYLPWPHNTRLVAMLYSEATETTADDPYDI